MSEYVIETKGLTKEYNGKRSVSDLNLHIKKGRIYGLLGRNGAGKTTTMKMILNLIDSSDGEVIVFGKSMKKYNKEILPRIGCLIESPGFYPNLTGTENLKIFAQLRGIPKRNAIKESLELVGLKYNDKKLFSQYSMGMKQRLAIALAVMHDPEILILDEPINGLDPIGIAEVRTLWSGKYLYVLAEVVDDVLNSDNEYDHEKDSVELFVDLNNAKTPLYDEDDAQYRINYKNEASFNGNCNVDNFNSATKIVEGGYIIEAAIYVGENKENSLIGFDVQVNDADATGKRVTVANWCDMSGMGWQRSSEYGNLIMSKNVDVEAPDEENNIPIIIADDIVLNLGDEFNPYDIVIAKDKEDGNITDKVKVVKNTVNTKRIGEYKVIYSVEDSKGASAIKEIKVIVTNKNIVSNNGDNNNSNKLPQTGNENVIYMVIIAIIAIFIGSKLRYNKIIK